MSVLRLILVLALPLVALLGACSFNAYYNPAFTDQPITVEQKLPGKALVYNTPTDAKYVFSGHPTSFTGGGTTLSIELGDIADQIAVNTFDNLFQGGASFADSLNNASDYAVVVTPKVTSFSYAYNQLKNLGFAITPQVDINLHVKVTRATVVVLDKNYTSGLVDGKSYMLSGSPGEEASRAAHKVISDLMNQAARDTYQALANPPATSK